MVHQRWSRFQSLLTDKNDSKTKRVDADFLENGGKILHFKTKTKTCGRGP